MFRFLDEVWKGMYLRYLWLACNNETENNNKKQRLCKYGLTLE